jgi:endoglucanase
MKTLIEKLVSIPGPSGFEHHIREAIQEEINPHVDDITVDALGNLIARVGDKTSGGKRIMLSGHMDEIGLIATHIDENGFIRFSNLGGVNPKYCPGGHVQFLDGPRGVIDVEGPRAIKTTPDLKKMYIDVGAKNREECPVQVGDAAVFERPFLDLGDRVVTKALDDRIGVAVMVEALRRFKNENRKSPHELMFVFSTQEEVGLRGAGTSAFRVEPDVGLALDVTLTGDTPKGVKMEVSLGNGPAIKVRDGRMISDTRVVEWMVSTATEHEIPYQLEVLEGGTTDAASIQISRAGVPAGCISIPCRYVHSPSEMVDMGDVEGAVLLLLELITFPIQEL